MVSTSGGKRELEGSLGATDGIPGGGRGIPGGSAGIPGGGGGRKDMSVVESNNDARWFVAKLGRAHFAVCHRDSGGG
jgi:hypothetical protein